MSFDSDLASSLRENQELIEDLCRYSEGILTEKQVRQRWHLANDEVWTSLGADDFVERVELEKTRRIRSGATKRELAQLRVVAAPDVLSEILMDPKANARHRIDASKALDDLAGFAPQRSAVDNMGADIRAKGLEVDPANVLHIEATVRPDPDPDNTKIINTAVRSFDEAPQELLPPRRGPGRPKGSRNKPKTIDERPRGVPGFDV